MTEPNMATSVYTNKHCYITLLGTSVTPTFAFDFFWDTNSNLQAESPMFVKRSLKAVTNYPINFMRITISER